MADTSRRSEAEKMESSLRRQEGRRRSRNESRRSRDHDTQRGRRRRSRREASSKRRSRRREEDESLKSSSDEDGRRKRRRRHSASFEDNNRGRRPRRHRSSRRRQRSFSHSPENQRTGIVSDEEEPRPGVISPIRYPHRSASVHDDSVGHFRGRLGAVIGDRYRLEREVGLGTFGRVVECLDLKNRRQRGRDHYVAIKIVRNVKRYFDSALIEARIIQDVNRRGGRGRSHCAVLHDDFTFDGHFCMVFENLGPSLYDFLKQHDYQPFPIVCIQDFAIQLLECMEFLHSFRLIHTDLKAENVLLINDREVSYANDRVPESTKIKVIDFGGACYDTDKKSTVINTRQYRAPEVILGTGWSMPSDMWSIGCILAELYRGELLFATHDNTEHLALIERTIGLFPRQMVKASQNNKSSDLARDAFDASGRHRLGRVLPAENTTFVQRSKRLDDLVRNEDSWFLDLLRMILVIDPHQRATAHECLQYLGRIRRDTVRYN